MQQKLWKKEAVNIGLLLDQNKSKADNLKPKATLKERYTKPVIRSGGIKKKSEQK